MATRTRGIVRTTSTALVSVFVALFVSSSATADPTGPFATITGTVAANSGDHFSAQPVATGHSSVVFRVTETGGRAEFYTGGDPAGDLEPGDVFWGGVGYSYAPGDTPSIFVENFDSQAVSFSVDFFDQPQAPATYYGSSFLPSLNSCSCSPDESVLHFSAPGTARYVADVTLSGGAITLSGQVTSAQTFDSSGEYSLGQLSAGSGNQLVVDPVQGPAAQWTITIRALPVSVYGASFDHSYAQAGTIDTLGYSTNGSTTISAVVRNAAHKEVRALATNFGVQPGPQSLTWDGRDSHGNPLPDGPYVATVTSTDPFGNVSSTTASIVLDSTPPRVSMTSHRTIAPSQSISFSVTDAESGVATISLFVDGQDVEDFGGDSRNALPANGEFSYPGPWALGRHSWKIQATDNVGNQGTVSGTFVASKPRAPLACNRQAANSAARQSAIPNQLWHRLHRSFSGDHFSAVQVLCDNLTGDHARGMIALYGCCTVTAPTPLGVFEAIGGKWRLLYSLVGRLVYNIKMQGYDLIEETPVYSRSNPLCCPSHYRLYRLHWNGRRFVTIKGRLIHA